MMGHVCPLRRHTMICRFLTSLGSLCLGQATDEIPRPDVGLERWIAVTGSAVGADVAWWGSCSHTAVGCEPGWATHSAGCQGGT
ncbi:hypothetical protein B0T19DRAFT_421828 [Cercophora scortea]|uniref:Secreted protein n=1 Tax=Cercophora scortea TaxID=314031 RepID=A0AAE0IM04_9PEZI|nr:hypothetical protein B0T19DRAFT_421828 [Cercophora scortea]